jgi:hypothetical protein
VLPDIIPSPLHPAVVHLPIALAVLVPAFAVGALWAIRRGARPLRAWGIATAMLAALSLSSWLAVETGEQADEQVEAVVPDAPIETHEEAAEAFLMLSVIVLGVAAVGLRTGRIGQVARALGTVGAVALLGAGWRVGHSGGALVYRHGAASAYTDSVGGPARSDRAASPAVRDGRGPDGTAVAERRPSAASPARCDAAITRERPPSPRRDGRGTREPRRPPPARAGGPSVHAP